MTMPPYDPPGDEQIFNVTKYSSIIPLAWCEPCDNPTIECTCVRPTLPRVSLRRRLTLRLHHLRYAVASLIYPGDLDHDTDHMDCE